MWQRLIDLQLPQDEPDAEGTIERFSWGLKDNVHRQVLSQDKEPRTMVEWQEAAQGEVHKIRKIIGAGLDFCSKQKPCDHGSFQTGQTQHSNLPRPTLNNNGIVPMEVDATQTHAPFAKLTTKNEYSSGRKAVASGAARRATWPESALAGPQTHQLCLQPHV